MCQSYFNKFIQLILTQKFIQKQKKIIRISEICLGSCYEKFHLKQILPDKNVCLSFFFIIISAFINYLTLYNRRSGYILQVTTEYLTIKNVTDYIDYKIKSYK